ncbi:MAG TPA: tetratricopeptide repeat protein [Anaerolineae bacterium]|nr:tetratricopeptide repeat protein [Anaerolineae bacterium]
MAGVSQRPTLLEIFLLVGIVLLAGGLRAYQLGYKSLSLDEILLVGAAQQGGLLGPYGSLSAAQPPAYLFLMRLVSSVSHAEWALRLPAILASTTGVVALWALGRNMFGSLVGLLAAFFLALSPLHIELAQEAHTYALSATLSTLLLWSLWRAAQRESAREPGQQEHAIRRWLATWGPFVLLAVLSLYTYAYAWVPVGLSLLIFPLFLRATGPGEAAGLGRAPARRAALRRLGMALAAVGLAALPLLIRQLTAPAVVADPLLTGIDAGSLQPALRLDSALFSNVLLAFVTYRPDWRFDPLFFSAMTLWWLVGLAWLLWRRRPIGIALGLWLLLPTLLLAWLASRGESVLAPRHLIFVLPVFTLVVATGVAAVARLGAAIVQRAFPDRRRLAVATNGLLLAILVLAFVKGSADPVAFYYRKPKQDWKTLAAILNTEPAPRDAIVLLPGAAGPLQWYLTADAQVIDAPINAQLERLCQQRDAIYVAEATTQAPLSEEDTRYLRGNYIRVPLADLDLYYRNCRPDAWYGAGADRLFPLAQHAGLSFPPIARAQEQFTALAAQNDQVPAAQPPPSATVAATPLPSMAATVELAPVMTATVTAPPPALPDQPLDPDELLAALSAAAPDDAMAQVRLGALALQQGAPPEQAGEHFQRAIDLDPSAWLAYGLWANSLGSTAQITQALQIIDQGLAAVPDSLALQTMQARWQNASTPTPASEAFQAALEAGRNALRERNWEDAIGAAQQAMASAPERHEAQLLLGDAYRGLGEISQALQAYQRATELAPHLSILHGRQAEMLARLGRADEAIAAGLLALSIDQGRWESWFALGRAAMASALAPQTSAASLTPVEAAGMAEAFLLRAQELAPADNQAPSRLLTDLRAAYSQRALSPTADAASDAAPAFDSMTAQQRTAARVEADQAMQTGQPDQALDIYQQLAAVDDQDRASRMGAANALAALGRSDEALAALEAISVEWPDFPFARIRQGALLEDLGDWEGALAAYREAVRAAPDNADTHFTLAYALRRAGQRDEAIAAFEAGLELDPGRDSASQALEILKNGQ